RDQGCRGPRARPEIADGDRPRGLAEYPFGRVHEPAREELDVEAQVCAVAVLRLLVRGQQVEEQRADTRITQAGGDLAIARAVASAAATVCEEYEGVAGAHLTQVALQGDAAGGNADFFHG